MEKLLRELQHKKVKIKVINHELKLVLPKGFVDTGLVELVRENKTELIDYIHSRMPQATLLPGIPVAAQKETYPLTSAQKRIHFLSQLNPGSLAYNIPQAIRLEGKLDTDRLIQCFHQLVERHESLRTSFLVSNGELLQRIHTHAHLQVDWIESIKTDVYEFINSNIKPFDLTLAPLMRVCLGKISSEEHVLLVDMHHIISDGVSEEILIREFINLYNGQNLEEINFHYRDYAEWQQSDLRKLELESKRNFWINQFSEPATTLDLPVDFTRPQQMNHEAGTIEFQISKTQTDQLKILAEKSDTTLFAVLFSVYNVLLAKLSNQDDIIVGVPNAGRDHAELKDVVGMFVNTLPIRSHIDLKSDFATLLSLIRRNILNCLDNQSFQFDDIVNALKVSRSVNRNPLFDVLFVYNSDTSTELKIPGLKVTPVKTENKVTKFDLLLAINEQRGRLCFSFEYATELFTRSTVSKFAEHFSNILLSVISNKYQRLSDIDILTDEDKTAIREFNDTRVDWPDGETVMTLFDRQAARHPNNVALKFGDKHITYATLNDQSDKIASYLKHVIGIKSGDLIGILLEREPALIAVIFGIIKAGAAYVPIDPNYPDDRINSIIKDSHIRALVTRRKFSDNALNNISRVDIDEYWPVMMEQEPILPQRISNQNLAYVIYTSGSSGKPKGVMIEHHSLYNVIRCLQQKYPVKETDCYLLKTTYTFDVSVAEIFGWFLDGGSLSILPPYSEGDPEKITRQIAAHKVTHVNFVPSMFSAFTDYLHVVKENLERVKSLKYIFLAGEALSTELVNRFQSLNVTSQLENIYGPTEGTIYSCGYSVDSGKPHAKMYIGKPLANIQLYIVDKYNNLQPIGVPGELCIAGEAVARGYLHNESLTATKFIQLPDLDSQPIYKTGDLVRLTSQSNIEYLGRIDDQVKIRGFRIELSEIENRLLDHQGIKEVTVVARQKENDKILVAYFISTNEIEPVELKVFLSQSLPYYMVPAHFVRLEKFPINRNGKLDKSALPEPVANPTHPLELPTTETEQSLLEIWSEVLNLDKNVIGVDQSFFDLGGHSLSAVNIINKIEKRFGVEIPLMEIFSHQDIRSLSELISANSTPRIRFVPIPKAAASEYFRLSPAQERIYFLYELDKKSTAYNIPIAASLKGQLDKGRLTKAFQQLIDRHESLRTVFKIHDNKPCQRILEHLLFDILFEERSRQMTEDFLHSFIQPFNLTTGPLIRVVVIKNTEPMDVETEEHILLVDMHHIISDGFSIQVLMSEFIQLYNDESLDELHLQYKDYAEWQQNTRSVSEIPRNFWLNEFSELPNRLELPGDSTSKLDNENTGKILSFQLEKQEVKALQEISRSGGATLYMTLLSCYYILLSKLGNVNDVVIGTPVAGRSHDALERVIGMFVNILPIRTKVHEEMTFIEFLNSVKLKTLNCFDHQDYQYEELLNDLKLLGNVSPLFNVAFAFEKQNNTTFRLGGLSYEPLAVLNTASKFDLTFSTLDSRGEFTFQIEYKTSLFSKETIERFISYFKNIIREITQTPEKKIADIEIISSDDKRELLYGLNRNHVHFPNEKGIIDLFKEQVARTPEKIAITFEKESLNYSQLDQRSSRWASGLRDNGVGSGDIVGLFIDRSIETVVGMLAILKCGCAYLPLDVDYPEARIKYYVEDSGIQKLLTTKEFIEKVPTGVSKILVEDIELCEPIDEALMSVGNRPSDLCYVIYTSGTTGYPKGVMVDHRNVVRLFFNDEFQFDFGPDDVWTMFHSPCFDFSVWEIYGALLFGGRLIVVSKMKSKDTSAFLEILQNEGVTVLNQTPSAFYNIIRLEQARSSCAGALRYVIFGGEALSPSKLKDWYKRHPNVKLVNMFGITETTVHVTFKLIGQTEMDHHISNIGKPIATLSVVLLDKNKKLVPKGVIGELYVGGEGVTQGYLHKPDLTLDKFIDHPYCPGEKLYRSGDLARILASGELEYLGRIDHQVQLRGFRIELGEIEQYLLTHENVKEAVVLPKGNEENKILVAYYVAEKEIQPITLKGFLENKLPAHMVPTYFIWVPQLPLTSNGKLDRKALPEPNFKPKDLRVEAANTLQQELIVIWSDVLKRAKEEIGIRDNFFEIGGHSILAVHLMHSIQEKFSVHLELKDIFENVTIEKISEILQRRSNAISPRIAKLDKMDLYPVSSAQERLFYEFMRRPNSLSANISAAYEVKGEWDEKKVITSLQSLINRHAGLRTYFIQGDRIEQSIHISRSASIEAIDSEKYPTLDSAIKNFVRPFDLLHGPLIRIGSLHLATGEIFLLVDIHHIICDGYSLNILMDDFKRIYNGDLPRQTLIDYVDYAWWQNNSKQNLQKEKKFWATQLAGDLPTMDLPTIRDREGLVISNGAAKTFSIDKEIYSTLRQYSIQSVASEFMVMLSVFYVFLHKMTGKTDLMVGTDGLGRVQHELKNVVGTFINVLPLRQKVQPETVFKDFLQQVKSTVLLAFENQEYPFDQMSDLIESAVNSSIVEVYFSWAAKHQSEDDIDGLQFIPQRLDRNKSARYELEINIEEHQDCLDVNFIYSTDLYDEATIELFGTYYLLILRSILCEPEARLEGISLH